MRTVSTSSMGVGSKRWMRFCDPQVEHLFPPLLMVNLSIMEPHFSHVLYAASSPDCTVFWHRAQTNLKRASSFFVGEPHSAQTFATSLSFSTPAICATSCRSFPPRSAFESAKPVSFESMYSTRYAAILRGASGKRSFVAVPWNSFGNASKGTPMWNPLLPENLTVTEVIPCALIPSTRR